MAFGRKKLWFIGLLGVLSCEGPPQPASPIPELREGSRLIYSQVFSSGEHEFDAGFSWTEEVLTFGASVEGRDSVLALENNLFFQTMRFCDVTSSQEFALYYPSEDPARRNQGGVWVDMPVAGERELTHIDTNQFDAVIRSDYTVRRTGDRTMTVGGIRYPVRTHAVQIERYVWPHRISSVEIQYDVIMELGVIAREMQIDLETGVIRSEVALREIIL